VTSAGWQVTLCDAIWHVSSRSGVAAGCLSMANRHAAFTYLLEQTSLAVCLVWYMSHHGLRD